MIDLALPDPQSRPSLAARLFYAIGLSLLFVVLYGSTNYYASTLDHHYVLRYEWEQRIPLLPWFVIPYMSIDLFFFLSFFLCTTRAELRNHAARLAAATVVAAACFALFPMKLGMERPHLPGAGINGAIYNFLTSFDQPHNLCPSLHVAYTLILRIRYSRHTRGATWWLFHVWFTLVSFSVLFVHQHHVVDLVGGAALATMVMYAIPRHDRRALLAPIGAGGRNAFVGSMYAAGAAAFAAIVYTFPLTWPLAWLVVMLGLLAGAYFYVGPRVFRKSLGALPVDARVIFGPYLAGLWVSRRLYNAGKPAWVAVTPNVWLGRVMTNAEAARAIEAGCVAVLDLTAEHDAPAPLRTVPHLNVAVLDLTAPTESQVAESVEFIERHAAAGPVLVHCGLGRSRSAAVVARYLLHSGAAATLDEAIALVRAASPKVNIRQ